MSVEISFATEPDVERACAISNAAAAAGTANFATEPESALAWRRSAASEPSATTPG